MFYGDHFYQVIVYVYRETALVTVGGSNIYLPHSNTSYPLTKKTYIYPTQGNGAIPTGTNPTGLFKLLLNLANLNLVSKIQFFMW